jgi:hypothetical protein
MVERARGYSAFNRIRLHNQIRIQLSQPVMLLIEELVHSSAIDLGPVHLSLVGVLYALVVGVGVGSGGHGTG